MKRILLLMIFSYVLIMPLQSKTKRFGTWIELEFSKEIFKDLELSFIPEIRLQDNFTVDEYMFDGVLSYEPWKFLKLSTAYRINTNVKKKEDETMHRLAFDIQGFKDVGRFEVSFRARFTNYTDQLDDAPGNVIRPRIKLEYDIKGNKIRPFASYELFHNITEKDFQKARFNAGFTRKLGNLHRVGAYYRLQDYFSVRKSVHILGLEYRLKI